MHHFFHSMKEGSERVEKKEHSSLHNKSLHQLDPSLAESDVAAKPAADTNGSKRQPLLSRSTTTQPAPRSNEMRTRRLARTRTAMLLFPDMKVSVGAGSRRSSVPRAINAVNSDKLNSPIDHDDDDDEDDDDNDDNNMEIELLKSMSCMERWKDWAERSSAIRSWRNPTGRMRRHWNLVIFVFVLFNVITIPLRFAFHQIWHAELTEALFLVVDYIGDVCFFIDIALNFFTPFIDENGFFVTSHVLIRHHYLTHWFPIDIISSLPLGFISFTMWKHVLLRTPRLLRILKYDMYFKIWEQDIESQKVGHVLRFTKLLLGFFMVLHWTGCCYIAFGYIRGFDTEWLPAEFVQDADMSTQYIYGLYWATNIVTGVGGEAKPPTNNFEKGVTLCIALIAIFVVAIIIGNVAELIAELSQEDERFRHKMGELNLFMKKRNLPEDLKIRIRTYHRNIWVRDKGLDDGHILAGLPVNLRNEIAMVMNHDIIQKVELFQRSSAGFVHQLISCLKSQSHLPGDSIITQGQLGNEMFFVRHGLVDISTDELGYLVTLKDGSCFGEVALLQDDCVRTAHATAAGFVDLFVLHKTDLEETFQIYPQEKQVLHFVADTRLASEKLKKTLSCISWLQDRKDELLTDFHKAFEPADVKDLCAYNKDLGKDLILVLGQQCDALYFLARGELEVDRETPKSTPVDEGEDSRDGDEPTPLTLNVDASVRSDSSDSDTWSDSGDTMQLSFVGKLVENSFFGCINNGFSKVQVKIKSQKADKSSASTSKSPPFIMKLTREKFSKLCNSYVHVRELMDFVEDRLAHPFSYFDLVRKEEPAIARLDSEPQLTQSVISPSQLQALAALTGSSPDRRKSLKVPHGLNSPLNRNSPKAFRTDKKTSWRKLSQHVKSRAGQTRFRMLKNAPFSNPDQKKKMEAGIWLQRLTALHQSSVTWSDLSAKDVAHALYCLSSISKQVNYHVIGRLQNLSDDDG